MSRRLKTATNGLQYAGYFELNEQFLYGLARRFRLQPHFLI